VKKGIPKAFEKERHMKRGDSYVRNSNGGITATLQKDRKGILLLWQGRIKVGPLRTFYVHKL
jgi:hypothetical protein